MTCRVSHLSVQSIDMRTSVSSLTIGYNARGLKLHYESEFYEESSLYGQTPAKILAEVTPK